MKIISFILMLLCGGSALAQTTPMLVRISEIEIHAEQLREYTAILKAEAAESVKLEKGVVAIFPMFKKADSTQCRILEIYSDQEAYQSHLKTSHFQYYKSSTAKMVKSLKLVDMNAIDEEAMQLMFRKKSAK